MASQRTDEPELNEMQSSTSINSPTESLVAKTKDTFTAKSQDQTQNERLIAMQATLPARIAKTTSKIHTQDKLGIKLRNQRQSLWSAMDDCEVTMHVEERTIYMAVRRDRMVTLAKLKKARGSRRRFHRMANDK
jgi:hypothetical protein